MADVRSQVVRGVRLNMIEFSIIIPAKNEAACIGKCLDSIFQNNYPREKYEVFVMDNGSSDSTTQIAKARGAMVYRIPLVNISSLRNYGAEKAGGKVLAFIDADCTVAKDWLQQAQKYINREDVACFGSPPSIPADPTWVQKTWFLVRRENETVTETPWLESMNMFIRKNLFQEVGGFNEALTTCEDVDISYRLSNYGRIISDLHIKAVHYGEAKTLREFFQKERWRGKSNYKGFFQHGFRTDELPSIILPLYYGLLPLITLILLLVTGRIALVAGALLIWQLPILALAFLKIRTQLHSGSYLRLITLYNVYYAARLMAIV